MSTFTKYYSETDVDLFLDFNIDIGDALKAIGKKEGKPEMIAAGERIDEHLWHFRQVGREGLDTQVAKYTPSDTIMNNAESRAARVQALADKYAEIIGSDEETEDEDKVSPFDIGMEVIC